MKKKLLAFMAVIMAAGMLVGCDSEDGNTPLKDMEVEKYVTLGEYKGLAVTVAAPAVDETELENLTYSVIQNNITAENGITDRAVADGDVVNIDYVGKKDDVAFNGGTAAGYNLVIGSGTFIDGFEEGLVGVMPGETVDLQLKFPEGYDNADLAGQDVVFTVTVNFIMPDEINDELIANLGIEGVTNQEELRQYVYDYLYAVALQNQDAVIKNAVLETFVANNTYEKIPKALLEKYEETSRANIESAAAYNAVDVDTFTNYYYGMDFESFIDDYCEDAVKQDLALQAVANAENLNISDEELETMLSERATASGYASVEEYVGETDKEEFREYFMFEKVLNYLVENSVISEE